MKRAEALSWFGLLGAPVAFTIQHVLGITFTQWRCGDETGPTRPGLPLDTLVIVTLAAAVVVIVAAEAAAIVAWRSTRDSGESPPGSRIHFISVIAMTITPLFLAIVLMDGLGSVVLPECVQG